MWIRYNNRTNKKGGLNLTKKEILDKIVEENRGKHLEVLKRIRKEEENDENPYTEFDEIKDRKQRKE